MGNNTKRNTYMRNWYKNRPLVERVCMKCDKAFMAKARNAKYCSRLCSFGNQITQSCVVCEKEFNVKESYAKSIVTCSKECRREKQVMLVGEKAHNWQGGKTDEATRIRTSKAYKEWRSAVFERDNYTCKFCGDDAGGNLEADHIKPKSIFPELTLELDNGRTLCVPCHKDTETWGRKLFTYRKTLRITDKI